MPSVYAPPGLTEILADIISKKDWNTIDKSLLESAPVDNQFVEENVHRFLRKLLENNNGALDLYGPEASLFDDIGAYSWYYHDVSKQYCDSNMLPFISKAHGFRLVIEGFFAQSAAMNVENAGKKIVNLFIESLNSKIERQLAGTYELVSRSWIDVMLVEFYKTREKSFPPAKWTVSAPVIRSVPANSPPIDNSPLLYEYTDYHKVFDMEYDGDLIERFKEYLAEFNSGPQLLPSFHARKFSQMHNIIQIQLTILETIKAISYPLLPFPESKKVLGSKCPSETPAIRLISLESNKCLFVKDVDDAIRRALIKKKKKPVVPDDLLYLESAEEKKDGMYYMIPHSEYLEVLKKMQIDEKDITLVDETVARARSSSVPIFSPYGTKCKSEIDVFYELLSVLMFELRVWENHEWNKLKELNTKIEEVCKMFMDPTKPRCFIDCSRINQLKDHLRTSAKAFEIPDDLKSYDSFAPYPAGLSVASLQKGLRFLEMAYQHITTNAHFVNVQRTDFHKTKTISRLEYLLAIRDCIAMSLIIYIPLLRKYICFHGLCLQHGLVGCKCVNNEKNNSVINKGESVVLEEADFDVEFENFEWTGTSFGVMKNKKTGQKLITNSMAVTYLMNQLKNRPIPNSQLVTPNFAFEIPKTLNDAPFLITTDELKLLEKDVTKKFDAIHNWHIRVDDRLGQNLNRGRTLMSVMNELLNYSHNHLANVLSFEKYRPNRVFFPFHLSQKDPKTGLQAKYSQTGEFLGLLKMRMFKEGSGATTQQLGVFYTHLSDWKQEDKRPLANVHSIKEVLKEIGMDSDRFCVVPKLFCQFDNVPVKVSRQLQGGSKDAKTIGRAIEELKKAKTELIRNVELVAEKDAQLKALTEQMAGKEKEIQKLLQQDARKTDQLDKIQKENQKLQDAVKYEKQALKVKEELWKKESGKATTSKNAEIQKLKQQIVERENQVKNLENNHKTLTRSIRADLSTCREEKAALERQLAQATAKILNLEAPRMAQVDMDAQLAAAIQKNEQLIGESQYWQSQHRMETMNRETYQQQNGRLHEHIQLLENQLRARGTLTPPAPNASSLLPQLPRSPDATAPISVQRNPLQSGSSSTRSPGSSQPSRASQPGQSVMPVVSGPGSAPLLPEVPTVNTEGPSQPAASPNPAPTPPPAPIPAPSAPECSICLNDLTRNSRKTECGRCKKQFHKSCINQWTATNATCPMCRSSFPNPQDFPPLGSS